MTNRATATTATAAGAATWEVTLGLSDDGAAVNLYLPGTIHVYVGNTVRWHVEGRVEMPGVGCGVAMGHTGRASRFLIDLDM